jgi:hypothetical protein
MSAVAQAAGCVAVLLVFWALVRFVRWVDARKPKQQDWVAQRHREIRKAGFKTRMGAR